MLSLSHSKLLTRRSKQGNWIHNSRFDLLHDLVHGLRDLPGIIVHAKGHRDLGAVFLGVDEERCDQVCVYD
jgi:hypothetical protein